MPPKVAAPAAAAAAATAAPISQTKNCLGLVKVSKSAFFSSKGSIQMEGTTSEPQRPPSQPLQTEGLRLRVFSSWTNCSFTTPIFGTKDSPPWAYDADTDRFQISFSFHFDSEIVGEEKLKSFHSNPGIYCVIFHVDSKRLLPVDLIYLDCSGFLVEQSTIKVERTVLNDYQVAILVGNEKPLMKWADLLPLEPVVLTMRRFVVNN